MPHLCFWIGFLACPLIWQQGIHGPMFHGNDILGCCSLLPFGGIWGVHQHGFPIKNCRTYWIYRVVDTSPPPIFMISSTSLGGSKELENALEKTPQFCPVLHYKTSSHSPRSLRSRSSRSSTTLTTSCGCEKSGNHFFRQLIQFWISFSIRILTAVLFCMHLFTLVFIRIMMTCKKLVNTLSPQNLLQNTT